MAKTKKKTAKKKTVKKKVVRPETVTDDALDLLSEPIEESGELPRYDFTIDPDPETVKIEIEDGVMPEIEVEVVNKPKDEYYFPQKRCPRCTVMDSKATSTQGRIQNRKCNRAICNETFQVRSEKRE